VSWCTRSDPSRFVGQAVIGLQGQLVGHLLGGGVDSLGAGKDVESEVAASFGPFVVLLSVYCLMCRSSYGLTCRSVSAS
jgi:hypothetical protein